MSNIFYWADLTTDSTVKRFLLDNGLLGARVTTSPTFAVSCSSWAMYFLVDLTRFCTEFQAQNKVSFPI